jgi:hypothetical protein
MMATDQHDTSRKIVPAAKGLLRLTWNQVEELDRHVDAVCQVGHGSVTVKIERDLPLFISKEVSMRFNPVRAEGC